MSKPTQRRDYIAMQSVESIDCKFVERLWRSVKYEDVYIQDYEIAPQAIVGLGRYFKFYNQERLHQSLDYKTSEAAYSLWA